MDSIKKPIINLLSVSVKICSGVLLYYVFMGLQTYLFNRLPYNLSVCGPLLMLSAFIWLKRKWIPQPGKAYILRRTGLTMGITLISMVVCTAISILLIFFITPEASGTLFSNLDCAWQQPSGHLITILNILLAAGMEEVLFRYLILALLIHQRWNRYLAMLFSAVVFALVHLQYNSYVLGYIILIGLALSMLYLIFRNIGPAIGLHFAINYKAFIDNQSDDAVYIPQSFKELWQDNIMITCICGLILLLWIHTQYVRPYLHK